MIAFLRVCTGIAPFVMWDASHPAQAGPIALKADDGKIVQAPIELRIDPAAAGKAVEDMREKEAMNGATHDVPFDVPALAAPEVPSLDSINIEAVFAEMANPIPVPALDPVADLPEPDEAIAETNEGKLFLHARKFAKDCLIIDQNRESCEKAQHMQDAYALWCRQNALDPFSATKIGVALGDLMKSLGGGKDRRGDKGAVHYYGCRFRPAVAHRLAESWRVESGERQGKDSRIKRTREMVQVRA
jgi:hypothetical protein